MMGGMATRPPGRSVKIGEDERTGWSSDRPRRDGAPPRPANLTVHCRVLRPADRLRYSPGSLLIVACADPAERDAFLERLDRGALGAALAGQGRRRCSRAASPRRSSPSGPRELLAAAVAKRLENRQTVVLAAEGFEPEEREPFVRVAAAAASARAT